MSPELFALALGVIAFIGVAHVLLAVIETAVAVIFAEDDLEPRP